MINLRSTLTMEEIRLGFDQSTDILKKGELADRLTSLYENLSGGSVCLLDGRWGTGKSTFVKQWSAELSKSNRRSIYFDAFASDYVDTPFTALAGLFIKAAHDARTADDPALRHFLEKASKVGRALAATSAKVGLKAATLGILDGSEIEGVSDAIAEGLGDIAEASVKRILEENAQRNSEFESMRNALRELAIKIGGSSEGDSKSFPLIVFIDELDRCRPDFSLGILEVLKHFYSVDGIHFVIVSSRSYLELAVDGRYGAGVAASEYLEKFYDFIVLFENIYENHEDGNVEAFIVKKLDGFMENDTGGVRDFKNFVKEFCVAYRLTLRQIENVCINACLGYISVKNLNIYKPGFLIAFAALVKAVDIEMYRKLRNGNLDWNDAHVFLQRGVWEGARGDRNVKLLRWYLDPNIDEQSEEWIGYNSNLWQYDLSRLSALRYIANSVVDRFSIPSPNT